ncbi:MAG: hypothetical protein ACT4N5_07525 [Nitrosopumilaceae archaeon]
MTLSLDVRKGHTMSMAVPKDDIEITNFRNYVLKIEGQELTSRNSQDKKLMLKVGRDGVLYLELIGSGKKPVEDFSMIYASVPNGYTKYHKTEAAKTIRGVKGKYLYFKNGEDDFIGFAVGPSGKAYKIALGKLTDKESKLRTVLDNLPDKPFIKAYFNDKLPFHIVENRQPIKAALDILEKLGYVKKTGNAIGISEEYFKTSKVPPKATSQMKLARG